MTRRPFIYNINALVKFAQLPQKIMQCLSKANITIINCERSIKYEKLNKFTYCGV